MAKSTIFEFNFIMLCNFKNIYYLMLHIHIQSLHTAKYIYIYLSVSINFPYMHTIRLIGLYN